MLVYRLGRTKFAQDTSGEGARLFGGRWNHKLTPCLYTAESRALAVLEYTVNVHIDDVPRALSMTVLEMPDQHLLTLTPKDLPGDWLQSPVPASTKDFGTELLKKAEYLVIKIPSVVIPEEYNYLVNPLHKDSGLVKVLSVHDFVYDVRIKMK
ncbi:RES family NAD+ phosphorylase [Chitinophagaceae bacterium LB-8]|uniref:RES family NAD+ phosphorylase n=1 Tax=Paraflavisolibacter caeni TaxID=2982496 RepID=A0A9X2XUE2_9BACT|nr:RES family NAD+ phosphorylase [Paraflavisolibacter caeni]MCU7548552.1 RES family NAD+ phosphorylase [Paraflavisolibacter caeni]